MHEFAVQLLRAFCIALGVSLGGSLVGSLAALLTGGYVLRELAGLADELKLWALITALGGTFGPLRNIELGLVGGEVHRLIQQMLLIACAFLGAHLGYLLLRALAGNAA